MSGVLVDSSVWRHFFAGKAQARPLGDLLDEDDAVLTHPAVIGELVLGGLSEREEELLQRLPAASEVSSEELIAFIRRRQLTRRGVGWVDCQLLASALVGDAQLWSADRRLDEAASELGIAFRFG